MEFDPNSMHEISFEEASKLTKHYREQMGSGSHLGGYFNGDEIQKILSQEGCVGCRIYYGLNNSNEQELVIVGVDETGNDMVGLNHVCMDMYQPCPPMCGENNILNS